MTNLHQNRPPSLGDLRRELEDIPVVKMIGRVEGVQGLLIEITGPLSQMAIGSHLDIVINEKESLAAEIVGFVRNRALAMPFGKLEGVRRGSEVIVGSSHTGIRPNAGWLGRVINAMGEPIDGKGPLPQGDRLYPLRNDPPAAHTRARVGSPLDLGVRAINTFITCCEGQRLGIFAGSGVGKSVLLSMCARNTAADVSVIGLVGERGREVQEFLQDDLGDEGLARSVVIVATSDESALMRRQAAYTTLSVAEFFRDDGMSVLCMMDSVTRFAMAQREIGLATGEPPTTKGYTPTVFAELPRLLERAGPGAVGEGFITGLFTVLVDGDDHNEPVADAVRSILDGHIVMERAIAERGRYPAINVLKSVSRTMPASCEEQFWPVVKDAKRIMATYNDMEELIRLGAYRKGTSSEVDLSIELNPFFEEFLSQSKEEVTSMSESYLRLASILGQGSS